MGISSYSIIMALLWFTVAALIGCLMLRRAEKYGLSFLSAVFIMAILRAALPLEYAGSIVLRSDTIYPFLTKMLAAPVIGDITFGRSLLILWGAGAVARLLYLLWERIWQVNFLHRIARENPADTTDNKLSVLLRRTCDEFGYEGKWKLIVSEEIPVVYQAGFARPCILLPKSMKKFTEQDICNVFRHEMQHFLGKHLWVNAGMQIVGCLLWWNPVMILLNRSIQQLLELLCDRRACQNLSQEEQCSYLETLIRVLKNKTAKPANSITLPYLGSSMESEMKQRFQFMLQGKPSAHLKVRLWVSCILCMVLFITSYLVILQPVFPPPPVEEGFEMIILTPQNSYILHTKSGEYIVYYNNDFHAILTSEESLHSPPHCNLQIIEEGDEKL